MKGRSIVCLFVVLAVASVVRPGDALSAGHNKTTTPKCKTGFVRKAKIVRKHGKPKVVHYCRKKKVRKSAMPTPAPAVPPASEAARSSGRIPHSHLDPTFERNPLDPFDTTWFYSASATEEITDAQGGMSTVPAPLPEGTLSFFVNGSLECAINVGPGNESSHCPVTLKTLGAERVTTTYNSGTLSSTVTEVDDVEPLVAQDALKVSYEPGFLKLHVEISPSVAGGWPFTALQSCVAGEDCYEIVSFPGVQTILDTAGNAKLSVSTRETGGVKELAIEHGQLPGGGEAWVTAAAIEAGTFHLHFSPEAKPGWIVPTVDTPLRFTP